ncbi:MAG: hypothetical protein AAB471_02245 [Patescibacteria group bacterium]
MPFLSKKQKGSGFKKIILPLVIFSLLLPSAFLTFPQKAEAFHDFDVPNWIQNTLSAVSTGDILAGNVSMKFKVFVLDPLVVRIARTILKRMTASIVQWINSGYQGSPSYLTNPNKFFADIAKEETNIFIIEEVAKSNNPYATDIVYSILNPRKGVYSLYDDIAYNCVLRGGGNTCPPQLGSPYLREAYARQFVEGRFGNGGWAGWYSLTQNPENNIYGAYIDAQQRLQNRVATEQGNAKQDVQQSGGFLSIKKCVKYIADENAGELSGALTERANAARAEVKAAREAADADGGILGKKADAHARAIQEAEAEATRALAAAEAADASAGEKTCSEYEATTPGKLVGDYLTTSATGPIRQSELVKDLATSIDLIVEAFINQTIYQGVKGLSDAVAGAVSGEARSYNQTYTSQLGSGTNPSVPNYTIIDPAANALTEINSSIESENEYLAVKNKSLGAVLIVKEKIRDTEACYNRIVAIDPSLNSSDMVVSGRSFASSTLSADILPREKALNNDVASSTKIVAMLKDIKQKTQSSKDDLVLIKILQDFQTLGTNKALHVKTDAIRADSIEYADLKTFLDEKTTSEITPRLDACLAKEKRLNECVLQKIPIRECEVGAGAP